MESHFERQSPDAVHLDFKYHVAEPLDLAKLNTHQAHSIILRQIPTGARVLDVGCATGYLGRYLIEQNGCTVDGVDADSRAADKAREYLRQVWVGSVDDETLLFRLPEKYNVI